MIVYRTLVLLTALDSLLLGLWALVRPDDLFRLIQIAPLHDAILWPVAGGLALAHAVCLLLAAVRPCQYAELAVVTLLARGQLACLWIWLLAAQWAPQARLALTGLAVHDGMVALLCAGFLVLGRQRSLLAPVVGMDGNHSQEEKS